MNLRILREPDGEEPDDGSMRHPEQDVPLAHHRDALFTEVAAAARARPRAGTMRSLLLKALLAEGGLTSHELAPHLGKDTRENHLVSPRVTECTKAGWVRPSGHERGGSMVWVLTDDGKTMASGLD